MADDRLKKCRDAYPAGGPEWRRPSDNAAEQLARRATRQLHVDLSLTDREAWWLADPKDRT